MSAIILSKTRSMRSFFAKRVIPIVFTLAVILMLFWPQKPLAERIDESIANAKLFAQTKSIDEDIYGSDYNICAKSPDRCPNKEGYYYKRLDIYLDYVYLKGEPIDTSGLENRISQADNFLRKEVKRIADLTIDYRYIDTSKPPGEIAFDANCILGWTYNDTALYEKMKNNLHSYGWVNPKTSDAFRKLIDETWCISLLAQNNDDKNIIENLVDLKKREFFAYINGSDYLDRKIISGIHLLLMFDRLQSYGYDVSKYSDFIEFVTSYVAKQTKDGNLLYPLEVYHNALYALSKIHCYDKAFLQSLAEKIVHMQNSDGSWSIGNGERYKLLVTLRSIIALNLFKTSYLLS